MRPSDLIDPAHQPDTSWGGIPYSVVAGLLLDEPVNLRDGQRPLAKSLREMMERKGMNRLELAGKIEGIRIVKSLRLLDAAIRGESEDMAFIRSIFQCLGVSEEAFGEIMREEKEFGRMRDEALRRSNAHRSFRIFGPHLTAMLLPDFMECIPNFGASYRHLCARVVYQTTDGCMNPPSPSEAASAIRQDATWLPEVAKRYVRAYIYHRMPDEAHVISSQGVVLFSGDWSCAIYSEVERLLHGQQSQSPSQSETPISHAPPQIPN